MQLRKQLNLTDVITIGYLLLSAAIISAFFWRIENWFFYAGLNTLGAACVLLLANRTARLGHKWLRVAHDWYPALLYTFLFEETGCVNHTLFNRFLDPFFQRMEQFFFGTQPALDWASRYSSLLVMEFFHFSYFTYYFILLSIGLLLYFNNRVHFKEAIFVVSFTFYACYLTYIFLPVLGARDYGQPLWEKGVVFVPIMEFIYEKAEVDGAAFPSSHVALAVVVLFYAFLYARRYFPIYLFIVPNLILSTVYCRYHYLVDVFGGIVYALVFFAVGRHIYRQNHHLFGPEDSFPFTKRKVSPPG